MNSIKNLSRLTGATYLLMLPFGILGILYMPNVLVVAGDMTATIENIAANKAMFHLSIFSSLVVQLIQILLVLLLYKLLSPISKVAGVLMVAFIIPAVSIAMLNEANLLAISSLVGGAGYAAAFTTEQIEGLVGMLMQLHESGVTIAQIFWGLWLLPMGYLVYRSKFVPKFIGILLIIGSLGYLTDSLVYVLGLNVEYTISQYTFFGEILLPLWLLFKAKVVEERYHTTFSRGLTSGEPREL